jgi:hypothetical protein
MKTLLRVDVHAMILQNLRHMLSAYLQEFGMFFQFALQFVDGMQY